MHMLMTMITTTSIFTKMYIIKIYRAKDTLRTVRLAGGNCYININYSGTTISINAVS
jgi:hypothetical protein